MTNAPVFTRAQEPGEYVAFEPAPQSGQVPYHTDFPTGENGEPDFAAIHRHPDFVRVQRRLTRFVFPAAGMFLTWYLCYVLLAAYAHGFMAARVFGSVTVALLLGLSQFVMTIVVMIWYARFTRTKVDPEIDELRRRAGEERS